LSAVRRSETADSILARSALKAEDKGIIEKKTEALSQASASIAQRLYASGAAPGGEEASAGAGGPSGPGGGKAGGGKEDVVDAEFEEVKDKGRKAS
jgi:molecular chaperone DnaK